MSVSISINGYSSKDGQEFQKHFKAVKFCIENELSFPKETSAFFKGKIGGDDLEDVKPEYILKYLEYGVEVELPIVRLNNGYEKHIKVSDIPKGVDLIVIKMS